MTLIQLQPVVLRMQVLYLVVILERAGDRDDHATILLIKIVKRDRYTCIYALRKLMNMTYEN